MSENAGGAAAVTAGAADAAQQVDAVALQVVHNRFETLMRLMTSTLEQLAGTAVGREAGDYSTAFMDADGHVVAFGSAVCTHLGHEIKIVPWILDNVGAEHVRDGDVFISNDPYTGGCVHSNDVGCVAPVFADGELLGWVFCDMHFADVGGMVPGSFAPDAIDVVAEAVRFPPTRIYAAGEYREDVVRAFINNTRIPTQIARDIASEVGALHFGMRAVAELAESYGARELKRLMAVLQDFSEQAFRGRLRELPDGVYEAADYIEDGYKTPLVYRASLRMTIAGDELYLDYRGSSPAAPALINCSEAGLIGGIMGPLIQQLATGIPFNAGVMRPVRLIADEGSFVDAVYPSPLGIATGYGAHAVQDALFAAGSTALGASANPYLRERATAQWGAVHPCFIFSGASNQYGDYSIFLNMDGPGGQGQGAMPGLDGGRGNLICLYGSVPSIEAHEVTEPFLYLSREIGIDSGGPGRWRGGFSLRAAGIVWGELSSPQSGTFCTGRNAVPTHGAAGGYPSSGVYYGPLAGARVHEQLQAGSVPTWHELMERHGDGFESLPSKATWEGTRTLGKGPGSEVFMMTHPGGGGFGDPLLRDPEAVAADVADGALDRAATAALRERLAGERFARAAPPLKRWEAPAAAGGDGAAAARPHDELALGGVTSSQSRGTVCCAHCGAALAPVDRNWKEHVPAARRPAAELAERGFGATYRIAPNDAVELAELFCPACQAVLAVELYLQGEPYRWDHRSLEAARAAGYDPAAELAAGADGWITFEPRR